MANRVESDVIRERQFVDRLSREPATVHGEVESVAALITESCCRLLDVARAGLWLFNESETELRCVDHFERVANRHMSGAVLQEDEFAAEFRALKDSLYVDASYPLIDPRTSGYVESYLKPNHITSMLDIVVRFGGKNLGTLCFEHVDRVHEWQQHEIDFGCMVGSQLSVLLERRALRKMESAERAAQERLRASQELDALKNEFLANVSHELRTPLTLLLGPLEDLLRGADPLTAAQRQRVEIVRRGGARLHAQVDSLLDFVALDAGRAQPTFEPTDLTSATRQLTSLYATSVERAGLAFRAECEDLGEPAWVDRAMWERIILNLLSNAFKFTHRGEISVTLRKREVIELAVADTGIGIAADALPRLFERFYRVPGAGGRTAEGTGIGLALVKELVQLHGGAVRVESKVGEGTVFRIELPRGHAHLPPERVRLHPREHVSTAARALLDDVERWMPLEGKGAVVAPPSHEAAAARRVLVVDDNADMRTYLAGLLGDYEVMLAADGVDALESIRRQPPDLVLTDLMMPRLDGIGLLKALRAEPSTQSIPVVLISARAETASIEALTAGADDYVCKPFSPQELHARIETHIELARMRREATESSLKDVFLGLAAHELRTPLTAIKLRLQLAEKQLARNAVADVSEQLLAAKRALGRAEDLAGELLSMSAVESRRITLHKELTDLCAVCREAAAEESESIGRSVNLELPEGPVEDCVDRERVCEIVKHLLSNALKFSPRGLPVTLAMVERGEEIRIAVRDEGPGIPAKEVPRAFEKFYRVPGIDVQTGSRVGLGVGLYVSRELARLHGCSLDVETSPGRGSEFTLRIPRERVSDRPCR